MHSSKAQAGKPSSLSILEAIQAPNDYILRLKETKAKVGLSKTSIYDGVKNGTFPTPIRLSARSVGWTESSLNQWIAERVEEAQV